MVDKVRCKFKCKTVNRYEGGEKIEMSAVCGEWDKDTGVGDDNSFAKYTPSGVLEISVANEAVFGFFEPGKNYYLDITPEPEEVAEAA